MSFQEVGHGHPEERYPLNSEAVEIVKQHESGLKAVEAERELRQALNDYLQKLNPETPTEQADQITTLIIDSVKKQFASPKDAAQIWKDAEEKLEQIVGE